MDVDGLVAQILGGRTNGWSSGHWASVLDRLHASRGREGHLDDRRLLQAMHTAAQNCGQQRRSIAIAIQLGISSYSYDAAMEWFNRAEQAAESQDRAMQAVVLCWRVVRMSGLTSELSAAARHLLDNYDFNGLGDDAELACSLSYARSEVHAAQVQEGDDQAEYHRSQCVRHLRDALAHRTQESWVPLPELRLGQYDPQLNNATTRVCDNDTL
jgi:hypothetical protein